MVLLVASTLSCDALIVTTGNLIRVHLENTSVEWLEETSHQWNKSVGAARSAMRDIDRMKLKQSHRDLRQWIANTQSSILHEIWTKVVWPVLQALQMEVSVEPFEA